MGQAVLRVEGLAESPLDASATFHAEWLPRARTAVAGGTDLALVFAPAGHPHQAWRVAAVQELAREAAPQRVNALSGEDDQRVEAMLDWLAGAAAITGQVLLVDAPGDETG